MDLWEERIRGIYARMTDAQRRAWDDHQRRLEAKLQREQRWVRQLGALAIEIEKRQLDVDWLILDLFWIRLHGVLTELRERYTEVTDPIPLGDNEPVLLQWARRLRAVVEAMLACADEDEVIMIDWLRHRAAHVDQRSYTVRLEGGTVKERRGIGLLDGKVFTIEEIDEARARVFDQHGGALQMQVGLARKLVAAIVEFVALHEESLST